MNMNTIEGLAAHFGELDNHVGFLAERMNTLEKDITRIGDSLTEERRPGSAKLFTALAKAQATIDNAELDATNPHYGNQYATLASVMNAIRKPLSDNGLSLIQRPQLAVGDKVSLGLITTLAHESGEYIEDYFEMYPPKQDPQGIGSCLTYMRRYTAMAMLGISGAIDDDAESALAAPQAISPPEVDQILNVADELFGEDADAIVQRMCEKTFMIDHVGKIPQGQAELAIRRLQNQKKREQMSKSAKAPKKQRLDDEIPQE